VRLSLDLIRLREFQVSYRKTIQELIDSREIESVLRRGSRDKNAVRALQNVLHELGFDLELEWEKYGADGIYGGGTTKAVRAFAGKNGIDGDGERITPEIAAGLIGLYDLLDELQLVRSSIEAGRIEELFYRNSPHSAAIVALQTLLNELGFGRELKWERYGADGIFGGSTANAVKEFGLQEGIATDGQEVSHTIAERIIRKFEGRLGEAWARDREPEPLPIGLIFRQAVENGRSRIYVSDGSIEARFTRFKNGVYTAGGEKPLEFIDQNRSSLVSGGLSDSAVNVMVAVSENEGNLDAVNTWDNAFLSFGMFQWTVGTERGQGELAALLKKVSESDPATFDRYYGQHGLGTTSTREVKGYLTLNGKRLVEPADKEALRSYEWAFRFWKSGQDPRVQTIEVRHALARLGTFYRSANHKVDGYFIADIITSEYGVSLILDNHVNRPAYVKPCLEKAMRRTGLTDPGNWGTDQERQLIEVYLEIRETHGRYPMTEANRRALVTRRYVDNGTISEERNSFLYNV